MKKVLSVFLSLVMAFSTLTGANVFTASAVGSGTTYYVDSVGGSDSNSGTSDTQAWKSLDKINATTFQAGDKILFKAGDSWDGQLHPLGSGAEGSPIVIDKYGDSTSLPCINGDGIKRAYHNTGAVMLENQQYWEINDLEVTNDDDFNVDEVSTTYNSDGTPSNIRDGILITINTDKIGADQNGVMNHIYVSNCYVHDVDSVDEWPNAHKNASFSGGIMFYVYGSLKDNMTFNDVRIQNNTIRKCDMLAIANFNYTTTTDFQDEIGPHNLWQTNIYIGHNYMQDIGQGGIDICDAKDSTCEYNVLDGWHTRYNAQCAGIYPWKSWNVTFQNNEVYNGPTTTDASNGDGTAFDFDSPNINIVYQYNYTHNNPMGWMSYLGRSDNNIARYNISDDNGSALIKFGWFDSDKSATYFLNNVFIYDGTKTSFTSQNGYISNYFKGVPYYFYNNVFYDTKGPNDSTWASSTDDYGTGVFSNNCFYSANGVHAAGEPNDSKKITADPQFVNPGQQPTAGTKGLLSGATVWDGYKLKSSSPLIDKGIYVKQMGNKDFYGTALQYGSAPDIGAEEVAQGTQTTPTEQTTTKSDNYALNQTVSVQSSNDGTSNGSAITDGTATSWTSASANSQYVEIDLDKSYTFNEIVAKENINTASSSGNYFPVSANIQKYDYSYWNGKSWIKFYASKGIGKEKTDVFSAVTTNKIRLDVNTTSGVPSLSEIEIYNDTGATPASSSLTDYASTSTASASSTADAYAASNMTDSKADTRWEANAANSQWVEFDFSGNTTFNKIVTGENIDGSTYDPRIGGYSYSYWDGTKWVKFYDGTTVGLSNTDSFSPVTTTKLRMDITSASGNPTLIRFSVYNDPEYTVEPDSTFNVLAHYSFDNDTDTDTKVADDSGNKLDATKSSSVKIDTNGKFGKALKFGSNGSSSDGYIAIPNNTNLNTSNFTISMWIKPDDYSEGVSAGNEELFSKGTGSREAYSSSLVSDSQWGNTVGAFQDPFNVQDGARWIPQISGSNSKATVPAGQWSQVIHTYDGHYYNAYINGELVMSTCVSSGGDAVKLIENTDDLLLGNRSKTGDNPFYGLMDDVYLLSSAISQNQVQELYAGTLTLKNNSLKSITAPSAITNLANGTAKTATALGLPTTAAISTDNGNVDAQVTWDIASSSYDASKTTAQTFTVSGTVKLPDGVINSAGIPLNVSVSVTVNAANALKSITAPSAITGIANGTAKTATALGLPTTAAISTDNGNVDAQVTWDVASSSYDASKTTAQTFTVSGSVKLPDGVINSTGISLNVTVSVTVNAANPPTPPTPTTPTDVTVNGNPVTSSDGSVASAATITPSNTDTSSVKNDIVKVGNVTVTAPASVLNNAIGTGSSLTLTQSTAAAATQTAVAAAATKISATPVSAIDISLSRMTSSGAAEAVHQLSGNITVTVTLTDAQIAAITDVTKAHIYYYDSDTGVLTDMGATFDLTAKTATFTTTHFSTYVLTTADKTAPVVSGVVNDGTYNADKVITFDKGTATLDANAFNSGDTVSSEGKHTLVVTDSAGNITTVTFTIDKTAPAVSGIDDNGIYSANKTITFDEGTATLDGDSFNSGDTVNSQGEHTLVVTDAAGNTTTVGFVIDKSSPVITVKTGKKVTVKNGGISAVNVTVSASDLFSVTKSVTLNGKACAWPSGSSFSKDGKYIVTVRDQYGHASKTTFTIDKTSPKIAVKNVKSGKIVIVTEANLSAKAATLNGKKLAWPKGGKFTKKGIYVITVTDKASHKVARRFKI